jgi:hypothetical protein
MADKRILYNFASRSRPDLFLRAVQSIFQNSSSSNFDWFIKVDEDDKKVSQYLKHPFNFQIGKSKNKVHAINRNLQDAPDFDILVNMSDDMVFTVPGFDQIIRRYMTEDFLLHFPDGFANERMVTMSIMSKGYFDKFGYVYHPSYKSLFCDNEAMDVAKILGCYKYIPIQIFEHLHPAAKKAPRDEQYIKTEAFWKTDKRNYIFRKALNFPL